MTEEETRPEWKFEDAMQSMLAVHAYAEKSADERIDWYKKKAKSYGRWARMIRFFFHTWFRRRGAMPDP